MSQSPANILQINVDFLKYEEFLIAEIHVGEKRHLIFNADHHLDNLRQAKRFHIDGTFKDRFILMRENMFR